MDCTELVGVRQQDTKAKGRVKMGSNSSRVQAMYAEL